SIAFSPTDLEVRTVDYGGHVARWSDSGTLLERNETKDDVWKDTALTNVLSYEELSAKWSRTKLVISNSQGRTVAHFDATDIRSVDFAKESRRVVFQVASDIRVYELDTGRVATVLSDISAFAYNAKKDWIVAGDVWGSVLVHDLGSAKTRLRFAVHNGNCKCIFVDKEGEIIVSGG